MLPQGKAFSANFWKGDGFFKETMKIYEVKIKNELSVCLLFNGVI